MTSRRRVKRRQLRRVSVPSTPKGESQVNHTEFDDMHFDDDATVNVKKPVAPPPPQRIPPAEAPSAPPHHEPETISFRVFKIVHDQPGLDRGSIAEVATREYGIPYQRTSAALWDHEFRKRIKADRTKEPNSFTAIISMDEAIKRMRSGMTTSPTKAKPTPKGEVVSLAYQLYSLIVQYPGRTSSELQRLLGRQFPHHKNSNISAALSRFAHRGLVVASKSPAGFTYKATAKEYPAQRNRIPAKMKKEMKMQLKKTKVTAPKGTFFPAPTPAPAPTAAPAPSPGVDMHPEKLSMRAVVAKANLSSMSAEDIVDGMTLRQAREVHDLLKEYFA